LWEVLPLGVVEAILLSGKRKMVVVLVGAIKVE
jgi:hypothetical protein